MVWTLPKTWINETLTAADMNLHIRDNFNALRDPPRYVYAGGTTLTTTSTSYAFIDITNLNDDVVIAVGPGKIEVEFTGTVSCTVASILYFRIYHNGAPLMSSIVSIDTAGKYRDVVLKASLGGVSAGTQTFDVRWYTTAGTASLFGGHYNFAIREVQ